MASAPVTDPWPRLRNVVEAAIMGLHDGRFIEETLEMLCVQLGAASAWSTLETKSGQPMHRSRTTSFQGVAPAVLAMHVHDVLQQVQTKLRAVAGRVPYASEGSFVAVPLWSQPTSSRRGRDFVGALYLEFPGLQGTQPPIVEFVECVGGLLGGMIFQQARIEDTQEELRAERATDHEHRHLDLDQLLSPRSMAPVREELRAAMASQASIMILGESGTGKTELAIAFARASKQEPIVRATLGTADDLNTITSELFGHERGAFSGAVSKRKGLVEYADGGTLILDEVLNLPSHAQQLLLDFTQFGSYRPLGYQGRDPKTASTRLISATNGDMNAAIADGRFRQDLYYRLATVPLVLPPLRERRWDIPAIAECYLNRTARVGEWELDESAAEWLSSAQLQWPGNIRELEGVLERARSRVIAAGDDAQRIEARHLDVGQPITDGSQSRSAPPDAPPPGLEDRVRTLKERRQEVEAFEKALIEDTLAACGGNVSKTSRILRVPRTGLISRMDRLEIEPERFKRRG